MYRDAAGEKRIGAGKRIAAAAVLEDGGRDSAANCG